MSKQAFEQIAKNMQEMVMLQIQGNKDGIKKLQAEMKEFYIVNVEQTAENHKKVDALFAAARGQDPESKIKEILES